MTLNEALIRQNFISKVSLKQGECELSKDLKVKVMRMRIDLTKIRSAFDQDSQEAVKQLKPENFDALAQKEDRTITEEVDLKNMTDKLNEEYTAFITEKGKEDVTFDKTFTEDEYEQIIEVNAGKDVEINGNKLSAEDFLEIIAGLFVESK